MINPVSAFAMASAAYNAVKKGIEMGQELEGMAGQLGQWFSACTDMCNFLTRRVGLWFK